MHKVTKEKVAIKMLDKKALEKNELVHMMSEIGILKVCESKHVAKIIEVHEDASSLSIVQELIEGPNLFDFITSRKRNE